jgi:chromate transporter
LGIPERPVNRLAEVAALFLKLGLTAFGGPAAHIAIMYDEVVVRRKWLTDEEFLDLLGGTPAALLATLGIFLPSFIFVAISNPLIPRIRNSSWASSLLDGVNASALGLMAAVTIQLGVSSLIDFFTASIAIVSLILLLRYKINSTWLIAGGGITGFVFWFIR